MVITNKFDDLHENWMDQEHYDVIANISKLYDYNSIMVEIGSWKGRSAILFLQSNLKIHLFCLDIWPEVIESNFIRNINRFNLNNRITMIKDKSKNIRKYFSSKSVDFIYLDACHKESSVYWDLITCFAILKENAFVLGDDWQKKTVQQAVRIVVDQGFYNIEWTKNYTFLLKKIRDKSKIFL